MAAPSHEPFDSIAAWPCSKASPRASVIDRVGHDLVLPDQVLEELDPGGAWSLPTRLFVWSAR
jgi:hypothetical protein